MLDHIVFYGKARLTGVAAHDDGFVRNSSDIDGYLAGGITFLTAVGGIFQKVGEDCDKIHVGYGCLLLRIRRNGNRNPVVLRFCIKGI